MALITPTTQALSDAIIAQMEAAISQSIPLLPKSFSRVLAKTVAGAIVLLYRYAGWMVLQMFVSTASMDETTINGTAVRPLVEWGRLFGAGDPLDGERAELVVTVTVLTQVGSLASDSQLLRSETGVLYRTTSAVALDAATISVSILAADDPDDGGGVGAIGNLEVGDTLSFANPSPYVEPDVVVASVTTIGADAETEDDYRARITRVAQARIQGGALADYREWAEGVDGVAAAYPYRGDPGFVDVYVECDADIEADGIAPDALLTLVEEAIDLDDDGLATRRPAGTYVSVLAIERIGFEVHVGGLSDGSAAVQEAINDAVDEHLRSREPYITGLSALVRIDRVSQAAIGGIVSEIVSGLGGTVASVTLVIAGTTDTSTTLVRGEKAKLADGGVIFE